MKYTVFLTRTQTLNSREVEAKDRAEAIAKAMPTFDKIDIDDYDEVVVTNEEGVEID